jgi:hypothetical protein
MIYMPKKKREVATRQPELHEIINALNRYRIKLHRSNDISSTRFMAMQSAIFGAKCIVRDMYGAPRKGEKAWIK